ncbi:outer membrane channel protein [Asticcacaulis biprosthecium C19]|uniref:Outer membrane channel protein n=1 Tax=Asticcacaulis biprosthecium C19 TaxID=715226 RepID=F4QJ49_9CAUL|nr:pilus assembly protein N-terminal domain-containing protein [Asticcacaulis biprosthecium]EGF91880.1 outer membrane channel protein [Asticcacaulis biprosthecium C19]
MTFSIRAALSVTAFGLMAAVPALAGQPVTVEKNHTLRVTLVAPAGTVVVGNPDIADVTVVDSRTLYIVGKGFGSSAVNVAGRDGRSLFDGEVTVTAPKRGAITVYKGLKPSLMVCTNVCISEEPTPTTAGASGPSPMVMAPASNSAGAAPAPTAMAAQ